MMMMMMMMIMVLLVITRQVSTAAAATLVQQLLIGYVHRYVGCLDVCVCSSRRPMFDALSVHTEFMVDKMTPERGFLLVVRFFHVSCRHIKAV